MIIGTGPAGTEAAVTLREKAPFAKITMISDEGYPFYIREYLIKYIDGLYSENELFQKGRDYYKEFGFHFVTGRVVAVNTANNKVILDDGVAIKYDSLLIASGGKPRSLVVPGGELRGVSTVYSLDDARRIKKRMKQAKDVVIVGGGTLALDLIPGIIVRGARVTVIEKATHILSRFFDPLPSTIIRETLTKYGTNIIEATKVVEIQGLKEQVKQVILSNNQVIPCDSVLVAIGIQSSIDFLKDSGIETDHGIIVNSYLQSNIPNIYAAGDTAQVPDPLHDGKPLLHPSWGSAIEQGKIAAMNMVGIKTKLKGVIFLKNQQIYDIGFIAAGVLFPLKGDELVVSSSLEKREFRKFVLRDSRLVGGTIVGVNLPRKPLKQWFTSILLKTEKISFDYKNLLSWDFYNDL